MVLSSVYASAVMLHPAVVGVGWRRHITALLVVSEMVLD